MAISKRCVVTLNTNPEWRNLTELTLPTHERYAKKIDSDFVVMSKKIYPHPHYDKWQIEPLFDEYERIIYLDADTIVRRDCPDLFMCVPADRFGGENELLTWPAHASGLREFIESVGLPPLRSVPYYINGGVFVASREHRRIFRPPEQVRANDAIPEQHHMNARLIADRVPMHLLPQSFNDRHRLAGYRNSSFIIHYSVMSNDRRVVAIKADFDAWAAM